jgi:hypothetical protein
MIAVILDENELIYWGALGARRHAEALARGLPDRHGAKQSWDLHIEGAMGEAAAAKALDRYLSPTSLTFRSRADVGEVEVRTRGFDKDGRDTYELIVRKDDKDDARFILVTGRAPKFDVHGFILGRDAKRPEWLKGHGGREQAYFVPRSALTSL